MELAIRNLTKKYKTKTALDNFSLTMTEGVWALLGPNGAGKTTMMNIAAGVLRPTAGKVLWDGADIDKLDADYRAVLGFLPQHPGMYKSFTAREFLDYMAALKGVRNPAKVIANLLEKVNLTADAGRKIGGFSGGMLRRLGIAQALLGDPKLLILDEPTAGLDPQERVRFRNIISTVAFDKIVIWATHIVSDVESIARQAVLLRGGKLLAADTPDKLAADMRGKVWMLVCDLQTADTLTLIHKISNVMRQDDGVHLRLVADAQPHENAVPVAPNLEDLYLYHF